MENLAYYEKFKNVPESAQKPIKGGRLNGMTDINPMWRIKMLTEAFGPAGIGWYTVIDRTWNNEVDGEIVTNVEISLYIKCEGEWSQGIKGVGGSKLLSKEKNGKYVSDESYKMAYTDAISVAAKALGIGADIYWKSGATKYSTSNSGSNSKAEAKPKTEAKPKAEASTSPYRAKVLDLASEKGINPVSLAKQFGLTHDTTDEEYKKVYEELSK